MYHKLVKIRLTNILAATGMSVLAISFPDKGCANVTRAAIATTKTISVGDYGAKPNDDVDDTKALNAAFAEARNQSTKIVMPAGVYDTINVVKVEGAKGVDLQATGAMIRFKHPQIPGTMNEQYILKIEGSKGDNIDVNVTGLTIDGSKDAQDLYESVPKADPSQINNTPITKGLYIAYTNNSTISNFTAQNFYGGRAVHYKEYHNVNIKNSLVTNVGAKEVTESIGDAFHFGSHTGSADIKIDNVKCVAKKSPRSPLYQGWIGVVVESDTIQSRDRNYWMVDKNTTVSITNSDFMDYDTCFHVETMAGNLYFNVDAVRYRGANYMIAAGIRGHYKSLTNNAVIDLTPYARNTYIHGVYHTQTMPNEYELTMYNSTINHIGDPALRKAISAVYGNGTKASFHHTTFNNVPDVLVLNATGYFRRCAINMRADNHRKTVMSLADNGVISGPDTTFRWSSEAFQVATKTTAPAPYQPDGYEPPVFTSNATPAVQ